MNASRSTYAFPNVRAVQRERLRLLAELLDRGTFRLLEARGVRPGWRCLEVGAGSGSVADWLCERVGDEGSVLATDIDTTVLQELRQPNLQVSVHDVLKDDLPEREFDLVHARLLLAWLADPEEALRRMLAALKPGGCVLLEEMDFVSVAPDPRLDAETRALFSRVMEAHTALLARNHAFNPFYGRRLAGDLAGAGLVDSGCEGRAAIWRGGDGARVWGLTLLQLRDALITADLVTADDVDAALQLCDDPRLLAMSQITMAAWGCRPG